jgi:N-acetylneuraminic acid mutarotase
MLTEPWSRNLDKNAFTAETTQHYRGTAIRKKAALLLALFLISSFIIMAKPVSAATLGENSWTSKAPIHVARSDLGVGVVNGKIYAIGGKSKTGLVDTNEEYDPTTNTWTYKTPMPTPSNMFVTAVCQNKIYCLGAGINEVYNPQTNRWEIKTPLHILIARANVVNDKIYVIGGYPNYTTNEVYDPATDTWVSKAPMPKAGAVAASAVLDDKIYFFGGNHEGGFVSITEIYNPATDTWSFGAGALTYFISGSAAVVTTGVTAPKRIYVFDHPYANLAVMHGPFYTNQVYDPLNDSWASGADILTSRQSFGVAVVNDIIYVIGGYYESPLVILTQPDSGGGIIGGGIVTYYAAVEAYTPFGYGTVPPAVAVVSPENETYTSGNVSLAFTVNKLSAWMGYSLDGQDNVTISGNTTITDLSNGLHNVTVYARDEFGNVGASATLTFHVKVPEPFPILFVVAASVTTAVVVGLGLLVYFKKRKH